MPTLPEVTDFLFKLTGFGLLVLVAVVLYRPPELIKRLKRFKAWEHEVELTPAAASAKPELTAGSGASEPGVSIEPAPAPSAEQQQEKVIEATKTEESKDAYKLLEQKKYSEALESIRKQTAKADATEQIDLESVFLHHAFREGFSEAFSDLKKLADTHPTEFGPQFWLSIVMRRVGQPAAALTAARQALGSAPNPEYRLFAAGQVARLSLDAGVTRLEAARIIGAELDGLNTPALRSSAYKSIAQLFKGSDSDSDKSTYLMMLEAAVRADPTNQKLLFDAAYANGDNDAEDVALLHYRDILDHDESHEAAYNNAGVAAVKLEMPVTGIRYYKQAEKLGNSLASANIGNALLKAGFIEEARERLETARTKHGAETHSNVTRYLGETAEAETTEEKTWKAFSRRPPASHDGRRDALKH